MVYAPDITTVKSTTLKYLGADGHTKIAKSACSFNLTNEEGLGLASTNSPMNTKLGASRSGLWSEFVYIWQTTGLGTVVIAFPSSSSLMGWHKTMTPV